MHFKVVKQILYPMTVINTNCYTYNSHCELIKYINIVEARVMYLLAR